MQTGAGSAGHRLQPKKNQKVEWTQTEPERNLAADGEDGGPGDQHGAERRPDFGDTTSLPVHF